MVSGTPATLNGAAIIDSQGFSAGTNASDYISWPATLGYSLFNNRAYPVTLSFGYKPKSSTGNSILGLIWGGTGANQIVYVGKETSTLVAAVKGETTSFYSIWSSSSGVFSANVRANLSIAFNSKTDATIMIENSIIRPTSSPGNSNQFGGDASPNGVLSCGYIMGGSAPLNGTMAYAYVHLRRLSPTEQQSINFTPYQMFYTESPKFYSIPSASTFTAWLNYYAGIRNV